MTARAPVTLHISVAPLDYPRLRYTVPHQLRRLAMAVDEVLITFDLRRSTVGYSQIWEDRRPVVRDLIYELRKTYGHLKILEVDYSPDVDAAMSKRFLDKPPVPHADARGGPFYAFLYGIHMARHDAILHLDGEMITGGSGAADWLERASEVYAARKDVVGISPLPGPPAPDGELHQPPETFSRDERLPGAYAFNKFSLRAVYLQRPLFLQRLGPMRLRLATPLHVLSGWSAGHPPYRALDITITQSMKSRGLVRVATASFPAEPSPAPNGGPTGKPEAPEPPPGAMSTAADFWTLFPPLNAQDVREKLPQIIRAVEANVIPAEQRGYAEANGTLNWAIARTSAPPPPRPPT